MYRISKQFHFSASHQLNGLAPGHKCARLHGHNFIVEVTLQRTDLDGRGFVLDYGDLKPLQVYIEERFDHRHLNDLIEQPTAERIAQYLYEMAKTLWPNMDSIVMRVSETPNTWAEYTE
jgi:6-pyruvoyltetrahydropterin/6-carboxytetrahydropterin synthase